MQAEETNRRLQKFIIKLIAGKVSFSKEEKIFRLSICEMDTNIHRRIKDEMVKYPEWKNQSDHIINTFIHNVISVGALCYDTRTVTYHDLHIENIEKGNVLILTFEDKEQGKAELSLISLGSEENSASKWMVLNSSLLALRPKDILEPYNSLLWSIGHRIAFKVYRNGVRFPYSQNKVFQTYSITSITCEKPSIIHEVIDSKEDFTFEEGETKVKIHPKAKLTTKSSNMCLLMHEFSESMPFYLDLDEEGIYADIHVNTKAQLSINDLNLVCNNPTQAPTNEWNLGKAKYDQEAEELIILEKCAPK